MFSGQFGLPVETGLKTAFEVVYATGSKPDNSQAPQDDPTAAWNQEAALDVQWAHAMAPGAKIVLVEAASDSDIDLFAAVDAAVKIPNVNQISMSWAGSEFLGETQYDTHFNLSGPVFFNAVGDTGAETTYPSSSQYVVAVGGTSVSTDGSGNWTGETAWINGGGGDSTYVAKPVWQAMVSSSNMTGSNRGTPDIASDADPEVSGVAVWDSTPYQGMSGWLVFGGTSVAAPCMAGIVNASGVAYTSTTSFLTTLYQNALHTPIPFRDITSGSNGFPALVGWDYATGLGAPELGSGTVTGLDVLDLVGNFGMPDSTYTLTGDSTVSLLDLEFMLLQLGW
jgi:subtilase family serine protease